MLRLYYMETNEFFAEDRFQEGCTLVDAVRLQKIHACKQTEDKVRSLCCGLLLQYAVSTYMTKQVPIELQYVFGEHGKPAFAHMPGVHFNLSHSGDCVVLAFSDREVGVDVQQLRPVKESMAQKVLACPEYDKYLWLPDDGTAREDWFARCWCAKECYGKLTGNGIGQGMNTLVFREEQQKIQDTINQKEVACMEYIPKIGYRMCVCMAGSDCLKNREAFPEQITKISFSHILSIKQY